MSMDMHAPGIHRPFFRVLKLVWAAARPPLLA